MAWLISKIRRQAEFSPRKKLLYWISGILAALTYLPTLARYIEVAAR
jgi:hypothetical protein